MKSASDQSRAGPYLHNIQRAVQIQVSGLFLILVPKRGFMEFFTLIGVALFGLTLTVTPLLIVADARFANSDETDYQPGLLFWSVLSFLIPILGSSAYLRRRRRFLG